MWLIQDFNFKAQKKKKTKKNTFQCKSYKLKGHELLSSEEAN